MGPHHHHHHHHSNDKGALLKALTVTLTFMVIEYVGGYISGSLALITDATHMLTDAGALMLALFALWLSQRPGSARMTYGYERAEVVGALISGLVLWLLCGVILVEAAGRFWEPPTVHVPTLIGVALLGALANALSMYFLHNSKDGSINLRAAYLHVMSDMLASLGAVLAGVLIWVKGWMWVDPLISVGVAILILRSSYHLVVEAISSLMEFAPAGVDPEEIRNKLLACEVISAVHDLHVWTVKPGSLSLSAHVVSTEPQEALKQAHEVLRGEGILHSTIQTEHPDTFDPDDCKGCPPPNGS